MRKGTPPIRFAGSQLGENRHACAFFHGEDEADRVLLPFICDGFECGDKAVHIVKTGECRSHERKLAAAGIDPKRAQAIGQLELRANTETYLRDGHFDQDRMLEAFERVAGSAERSNFRLNRIICHMDWAADRPHVDDLIEFESRVNEVWARHEDVVICVYDLAKFGGDTVIDIMRTHPMVVIGGILQNNPFYVPPEQFLRDRRSRAKAE